MTKHDFDKLTKRNHGDRMASDEREGYRKTRRLPRLGWRMDRLHRRAAHMAWLRAGRWHWEGILPTLGTGSPYRAVAEHACRTGQPLLG